MRALRRWPAVVLALLAGAGVSGCFTTAPTGQRAPLSAGPPLGGPGGDGVVQIDVAVLERPLGDRFVNRGLWELADEQVVTLEQKAVLDDNGFRVCQIGGLPPDGLQALLTSERSCPNPRRLRVRAGDPTPVLLGPALKACHFRVRQEDGGDVDLADAQCLLEVLPTPAEDGRTLLRFTPHVRHGKPTLAPRPARDKAGALRWEWEARQPDEAYPGLAWDVTVAPGEYVVVGTRPDRAGTLGGCCFLPAEGGPAVQRLLVIRTTRDPSPEPLGETVSRAPPPALRAAWTCARGTSR